MLISSFSINALDWILKCQTKNSNIDTWRKTRSYSFWTMWFAIAFILSRRCSLESRGGRFTPQQFSVKIRSLYLEETLQSFIFNLLSKHFISLLPYACPHFIHVPGNGVLPTVLKNVPSSLNNYNSNNQMRNFVTTIIVIVNY